MSAIADALAAELEKVTERVAIAAAAASDANAELDAVEDEYRRLTAATAAINRSVEPAAQVMEDEGGPVSATPMYDGQKPVVDTSTDVAAATDDPPEGFVKGPKGELISIADLDKPKSNTKPVDGPYGALKCPGCGRFGTTQQVQVVRQGKPIIMWQCSSCMSERL